MWYEVEDFGQSDACVLFAEITIPADSPWFCGHFPGEPILPGIAELGMVFDTIARACGGKTAIKSVSRVKFKQSVRPDDRLKIVAAPKRGDGDAYEFRIMREEEVVCSGVMTFRGSGV